MKVLKFQADWCGPCKMLSAVIASEQGKPEFAGIEFVNVDITEQPELAEQHGVTSIPTLVVLDENDAPVKRVTGGMNAAKLREFLL